ncbi:rRNA-processing protein fcf1 like [Verticillium longisporum]|uniref:rRNA-processing protein fcf1 like n=1 Tax=Verticillium longisporum TaxID=100787 RepID=A0A8I2ZEW5_VERLO|nr:rRNA-processing protein fcf1 like [Verticillium longisporum]KAG7125586.1 rRNA-processing protein fcf1 like [Verticillium longisporum]
MGVQKKTRKFAEVKRVIGKNDARRKENLAKAEALTKAEKAKKAGPDGELVRAVPQMPSQMFFAANTSLVPPYSVLVDTSFFSRTVQMKLPLLETMMDCLYATCTPIVTDCVMAELSKLGPKFRLAMRVARDERWEKARCTHKGVYADDCIVDKVQKDRIYIVATQDKGLQSRVRKIPGVPILKVTRGKYIIERLPEWSPETCISTRTILLWPQLQPIAFFFLLLSMDGSTSSRSSDDKDTDISGALEDRSGTGPDTLGEVHLSSGSATGVAATAAKCYRALLSCAACRVSKLKCDRSSPCGQCIRKGRPEACQYAPKPQRRKPNQSMASRLKRLEGMVRSMLEDGDVVVDPSRGPAEAAPPLPPSVRVAKGVRASGQVVHGERGSTYIGATHFMAMLEDIEDLKSFFDEEQDTFEDRLPQQKSHVWDEYEVPGVLLFSNSDPSSPRSLNEVISILPDHHIVDRLVMRYFASKFPSLYLIHRPTFLKLYREFWVDPSGIDYHWLAQLFMVICLATHFSTYMAPHELAQDSPEPPFERMKRFRSTAAWCLVKGKYHQPKEQTIASVLMYAETEFLVNRNSQMNCYLLASTVMRLMLKLGFHRDPSKLSHITAFQGEMRRRMWHMGMTLDLLVSFHMGLPPMIHGIDSDVALPRNVLDRDFGPESKELPPPQPMTDYTDLTYPLCKNKLMICFGHVARLAHLLTPPPYSEVLKLDSSIQEAWDAVPGFMRVRPIEDWRFVARDLPGDLPAVKKTADIVETMLRKIGSPLGFSPEDHGNNESEPSPEGHSDAINIGLSSTSLSDLSIRASTQPVANSTGAPMAANAQPQSFTGAGVTSSTLPFGINWTGRTDQVDWGYVDNINLHTMQDQASMDLETGGQLWFGPSVTTDEELRDATVGLTNEWVQNDGFSG